MLLTLHILFADGYCDGIYKLKGNFCQLLLTSDENLGILFEEECLYLISSFGIPEVVCQGYASIFLEITGL